MGSLWSFLLLKKERKPFKTYLEGDFNKKHQKCCYVIAGFSRALFDISVRYMNRVLLYYAI